MKKKQKRFFHYWGTPFLMLVFGLFAWGFSEVVLIQQFRQNGQERNFRPVTLHYSCADVGLGAHLGIRPSSGEISNQFERRKMVEKRVYDCFWRAWRYIRPIDGVKKEVSSDVQQKMDNDLQEAFYYANWAVEVYLSRSLPVLQGIDDDYVVFPDAAAWVYAEEGIKYLRSAFERDFQWQKEYVDSELAGFLGLAAIASNKDTALLSTIQSSFNPNVKRQGVIHTAMVFPQLTREIDDLLKKIEVSHTTWAEVAMTEHNSEKLNALIQEQHILHHRLEALATTPDQAVLLTIPEHTPHEVCWDRPPQETEVLLLKTEVEHKKWIKAVRILDFKAAWLAGLEHSNAHVMLSTCGITLH